jgi:adenylosuccinate lyase
MDLRYTDPVVAALWSPEAIYGQWLIVETAVLESQRELGIVPPSETGSLMNQLRAPGRLIDQAAVTTIREIENRTKHDVAAFLEWLRTPYGSIGRYLHYGLTSSDVVDTAQGIRFGDMRHYMLSELGKLLAELNAWAEVDTPILGYTHGQVAEPMTMKARAWHWLTTLATPAADLSRHTNRAAVCKLSGPVGTYAHNPPEIERQVATKLQLRPHGPGASQIASRAPLAAWANSAALLVGACAKIAMDLRLMDLLGETHKKNAPGQVGSSSMAHKKNPIAAEQIGGMARMARGYAAMLQPVDVWLERDISHSCVERVAVPDLWHVTMHSIAATTRLLANVTLDEWEINSNFQRAGIDPLVCELTLKGISEHNMDIERARHWATQQGRTVGPKEADRFMKNYPGGDR